MEPIRPWQIIKRRKSRQINVGGVMIGGDAPIAVQTMTNSITADVKATLAQINRAHQAGADLVRVSCPDEEATASLAEIVRQSPVPLVADIHFHYRRAIEAAKAGAACLRINPGNIGDQRKLKEVVACARDHNIPIRIGVNAGSLEKNLLEKYKEPCPEAMVESALFHAGLLDDLGFHDYKISVKASSVMLSVAAYRLLAEATDAPLHLGITEAGGFRTGTVKSSVGLGALLMDGIGDTIRVSLSAPPEDEVKVGFDILKSLGLRARGVNVISCPSCARQQFDVISVVQDLEAALEDVKTPLNLSVIGCVVNGPGEAKLTEIGLTGGGNNTHLLYKNGKPDTRLKTGGEQKQLVDALVQAVKDAGGQRPRQPR